MFPITSAPPRIVVEINAPRKIRTHRFSSVHGKPGNVVDEIVGDQRSPRGGPIAPTAVDRPRVLGLQTDVVDVVPGNLVPVSRVPDSKPGPVVDVVVEGPVADSVQRDPHPLLVVHPEVTDLIVFRHVVRLGKRLHITP